MRNAAQRLARLATALNFGVEGDCTCSERPLVAVTNHDPDGNNLPSNPAELAKLDFTCPVHGEVGPEHHVRIIQFSPLGEEKGV